MKRLLLPLLGALALSVGVYAGDLGSADFDIQKRHERYRNEEYKNMAKQDSFDWRCGTEQRPTQKLNRRACKVEYKNGKLQVDGSKGIFPSQVIHWTSDVHSAGPNGPFWKKGTATDLLVYYKNSDGKITSASFAGRGTREGLVFYLRFLKWMNEGK